MMKIDQTTKDDPRLQAILAEVDLPGGFDAEETQLVVVGEEEGVPVGFVSGLCVEITAHHIGPSSAVPAAGRYAFLEHIAIRPGFRQMRRTRALADAYLEAWVAHGFPGVITAVAADDPNKSYVEMLLARWPATCWWTDPDGFTWWVRYAPMRAPTVPRPGA